jgi:hypothetical protein
MARQTKRELRSGGVAHDKKFPRVKIMLASVLQQKVVSTTDVGERVGPASAFIAHAAVFKIGCRHPFGTQRRAKMACVIQVVAGAPVAAVNVDDERKTVPGLLPAFRQAQLEKLIRVRPVCDPRVSRRRWEREYRIGHQKKNSTGFSAQRIRFSARQHRIRRGLALFVTQRFDGIKIRRAQRRHHSADHTHHGQNPRSHDQNSGRNNQSNIGSLGVLGQRAVEGKAPRR